MKKQLLITSILFYLMPTYAAQYTEKTILELVKQFISTNPIIVEAGAHLGEDTEKSVSMFSVITMHSIICLVEFLFISVAIMKEHHPYSNQHQ